MAKLIDDMEHARNEIAKENALEAKQEHLDARPKNSFERMEFRNRHKSVMQEVMDKYDLTKRDLRKYGINNYSTSWQIESVGMLVNLQRTSRNSINLTDDDVKLLTDNSLTTAQQKSAFNAITTCILLGDSTSLEAGLIVGASDLVSQQYKIEEIQKSIEIVKQREALNKFPEEQAKTKSMIDAVHAVTEMERTQRFTEKQMEKLHEAIEKGATKEQVNLMAHPKMKADQMAEIVDGIDKGFSQDELKMLAKPNYEVNQVREVKNALEKGLTVEQVSSFASPQVSADQMQECTQMYLSGANIESVQGALNKKYNANQLDSLADPYNYGVGGRTTNEYYRNNGEGYGNKLVSDAVTKAKSVDVEKRSIRELIPKMKAKAEEYNASLTNVGHVIDERREELSRS